MAAAPETRAAVKGRCRPAVDERRARRLYERGPVVKPCALADGAWLREVWPDGMDAGGAPAGRAAPMARG
jgi:hypothetical protein